MQVGGKGALLGIECRIAGPTVGDLRGALQLVSALCHLLLRLGELLVLPVHQQGLVGNGQAGEQVSQLAHQVSYDGISVAVDQAAHVEGGRVLVLLADEAVHLLAAQVGVGVEPCPAC